MASLEQHGRRLRQANGTSGKPTVNPKPPVTLGAERCDCLAKATADPDYDNPNHSARF
jgi:hypothetical protein